MNKLIAIAGSGSGKIGVGVPRTEEVVTTSLSAFEDVRFVDLAFKREISEALFAMPRLYAAGYRNFAATRVELRRHGSRK